jgi:hypothetical protein
MASRFWFGLARAPVCSLRCDLESHFHSVGDYSLTFKTKGKILHSRVPPMAKYNLHQYVALLKLKKKFGDSPPSPFSYLFKNNIPSCHSYKFIR